MNEAPLYLAQPEFAGLFWVWGAVVVGLIWFERRSDDVLGRFVHPVLQDRLVTSPPGWRRWGRIGLLAVAGAAMIMALMQPQWGMRYVASPRVGAEIMIALDVSRSMLADDAKPTRLERAKAEISDLLAYLDEDYVGLIAFAGRASVLSPMTPDKSFLRLALDSAGPHSVTRGGTRLAEPIRRAIAGLGEPGPAQRALILITDGEDHDSFAMDAAEAAAEAGIKIIAIGFGDESGSRINLRDPKTGARALLRDGDGNPIVSRLDGDLLREIALVTDGAYVPAGTGVLDLASIYDAHIADLTRGQLDERGRTIRDEAYQFFVLLALVCLIGGVSISSVAVRRRTRKTPLATGLLMVFMIAMPTPATQAQSQTQAAAPIGGESDAERTFVAENDDGSRAESSTEDPRQRFNRANEKLGRGDPIAAAALFRDARRDATDDSELRYASTYNLGMAAVARAESLLAENPSDALVALYEAADWFREASAARPSEVDPRHNLDVTLRRALILADEINRETQGELEAEIDAMISDQRQRILESATLLAQVGRMGELDAAETLRPAFRQSATRQRMLLSEANALAERVDRERQRLVANPEEQRSPEDVLRAGQLVRVLDYLDQAIDRMGQTRRQLRQRRAERAYRRGSAALGFLKRARDQLRDPVELLDILVAEVGGLAKSTLALSGSGLAEDGALPTAKTLTQTMLGATQDESFRIQARVEELAARFDAASKAAEQALPPSAFGSSSDSQMLGEVSDDEEAAQRIALIEAAPLVGNAARAMDRVSLDLGQRRFREALDGEVETVVALAAARERFLDLRQLLNATYSFEEQIAMSAGALVSAIASPEDEGGDRVLSLDEASETLGAIQEKNQARALRLEGLLDREERTRLSDAEADENRENSEPTPAELETQRFDLARQRLALASGAMMETTDAISRVDDRGRADWSGVQEAASRAAEQLDALRSLFFSIAEHVRKLAVDQVELQDQTQEAAALSLAEAAKNLEGRGPDPSPDTVAGEESSGAESRADEGAGGFGRGPNTRKRVAVLVGEQGELQERADQIADALLGQAEEMAMAPSEEAGPEAQEDALRIQKAAEFVASAGLAMREAGDTLQADDRPLEPALPAQTLAIDDLKEALALLSPPPEESPDNEDGESDKSESEENDESDEGGEDGDSGSAEQEAEAPEQEGMDDPSQLLQGVRDREAERRRDLDRRNQQRRAEPVERDW